MHNATDLDSLLGKEEAYATFHDACLESIGVDYRRRELVAEWHICVGDPDAPESDARERRRHGRLMLEGLRFWVVEPPDAGGAAPGLPWLTADGPLGEAPTDAGKALAKRVAPSELGWYLYFSDWNAYAYCAAETARFIWK